MNLNGLGPLALVIGFTLAGCASSPSNPAAASSPTAASSRVPSESAPVDLTGKWTIDDASSDDPAEELESLTTASRETRRASRVGVGVSVFGIPVGDVTDLLPERAPDSTAGRDPPRHVTDSIDALEILQAPASVRVDYDGIGTFIYRNGETMSDNEASVHAEWRRGRYVVERQIPNGPLVSEEFRLDSRDASRLYWVVTIKPQSGKSFSITRVYDRVAEA